MPRTTARALPAAVLAVALAAPLVALSGVLPALAAEPTTAPAPVAVALNATPQPDNTAAFQTAQAALAEADRVAAEQAAAEQAAALAARAAEAERADRSRRAADDPKAVARELLAARGQGDQFSCLDKLWTKESDWRVHADNPTSSAYGIPQALPGKKMASAGADWATNPETQIRWGLGYIAEVYGGPCAAWRHSQARNWY